MASFKSSPIFYSVLIAFGLVAVGEGWFIFDRTKAATKNHKALVQKRQELAALQSVNPFPSVENKAAVEADLARTQAALATMREELKGRGPTADLLRNTKAPAEPTDAYFDITNFIEDTRKKAKTASVKLKTDERFGFSTYSSAGPDRDLIPQVFRQRQIAQYLIEALFTAHPRELVSFHRERPLTVAQLAALNTGQPLPASSRTGSGPETDLFEIDPRISARVPGFVNAIAFRLTFIGETESLRVLLNKLAAFELPLVVRSVEVEPATGPASGSETTAPAQPEANSLNAIFGTNTTATTTPAEPPKAKPLVEKVRSKFTVTVEFIDLVSVTTTEATPTS